MTDVRLPVYDLNHDDDFLKEFRVLDTFASPSERYYSREIYVNKETTEQSNQDLLILGHSNKIKVTTLSPQHDILAKKLTVTKIDFEGGKKNRLENKTQGKWKKGAQKLEGQSVLCKVECSDGSSYKLRSGVKGNLMEINKRLIDNPELLTKLPWSDGYIAVILPPFQKGDRFQPKKYENKNHIKDSENKKTNDEKTVDEEQNETNKRAIDENDQEESAAKKPKVDEA